MGSDLPILLLDGGLGTTLADEYNIKFSNDTPLWSSHLLLPSQNPSSTEAPSSDNAGPQSAPANSGIQTLLKAQTAFATAGADVILTPTYQASIEGFAASGVAPETAEKCMRKGVSISREAFASTTAEQAERACAIAKKLGIDTSSRPKESRGLVALSLGAYGATMTPSQEYTGAYDEEHASRYELADWHYRRLKIFAAGEHEGGDGSTTWDNIDVVAFETIPCLEEIHAVGDAMRAMGKKSKPFWISCVFPDEKDQLPDGSYIEDIVRALFDEATLAVHPMGVGINCTKISRLPELIRDFDGCIGALVDAERASWPVLVLYPDGTDGEVYNTTRKVWERKQNRSGKSWSEQLWGILKKLKDVKCEDLVYEGGWTGVIVGGCCKATARDIAQLRALIYQDEQGNPVID